MPRGRPVSKQSQQRAKQALLDAADHCLQEKSFKEISVREITTKAGQSSAMIAYYFGNKEALFVELLYRAIDEDGRGLLSDPAQLQDEDPETALRTLITRFVTLHRKSPWLSRFIVDNVILKQGKLRQLFVRRILAHTGQGILDLFAGFQGNAAIDARFDTQLCRISLMSVMAFPFVAAPLLKDSFDFDIHTVDIDTWVDHTVRLLLAGLTPAAATGHTG